MESYTVILVQNWKLFFEFNSLYRLKYLHESRVLFVVSFTKGYILSYKIYVEIKCQLDATEVFIAAASCKPDI